MRTFHDRDGRAWDVVVGRHSWGAFFALFVPAGPDARGTAARQAPLDAVSYEAAQLALADCEPERLANLFERSTPHTLE